jgi:UDPglucose--hexose-1-phosphate uridylyltransferase
MPRNEVRRDYLLNRWVVIATERSRRPTDFAKKQEQQPKVEKSTCPMCPGNENMTPPATLVYLKKGKSIIKDRDKNGFRHKDWLIRCVSNLFPAFAPPEHKVARNKIMKNSSLMEAVGHHEVLIESPDHYGHPADTTIPQLTYVINGYMDRLRELSAKPYVRFVSIFRNHGLEAGASLSHAHSQIIATPFIPIIVQEEMQASRAYFKRTKKCILCRILEKETHGPRLIHENPHFAAFASYAGINPLEFWIMPIEHQSSLLDLSETEAKAFAQTLKTCLKALKTLVNDPPYNYGIHQSTEKSSRKHYHWHLEVYPKLSTWAGFEKSTGVYINTVKPETAAEELRKTILG